VIGGVKDKAMGNPRGVRVRVVHLQLSIDPRLDVTPGERIPLLTCSRARTESVRLKGV
jgi:hypothetical protein